MTTGLYLLVTTVSILLCALWLRHVIVKRLKPSNIIAGVEEEVHTFIAELNRTGDQHVSIIEHKIQVLMKLQEEITQLIERSQEAAKILQEQTKNTVIVQDDAAASPDTDPDVVLHFNPSHVPQADREHAVHTAGGHSENAAHKPAGNVVEQIDNDVKAEMIQLHKQGFSPEVIASRTGKNIGEVTLIIALEKMMASEG